MRVWVCRPMVRITAGAAGLSAMALLALPAAAGARTAVPVTGPGAPSVTGGRLASVTSPRQRVDHSNTGAAHSPQVLRQLASRAKGTLQGSKLAGALQGVDVASFQHPGGAGIDWSQVAASGIQFAGVKATEGAYYQNPYALTDLAQAKAAGLSVVAYAFGIPNGNGSTSSPIGQADYLINYLNSAGGPRPAIMLDIEYNPYGAECYGLSKYAMVTWIAQFDAEVQSRTGQDPIIYTPPGWWQTCTGGAPGFGQVPLWVPDYTSSTSPSLPAGWSTWGFWQYSSTGTVSGINASGNTDLDQLNPALIPLLDPGSQLDVTGDPVNLQLATADPVTGQTLSLSATGLPPGVSISGTGQITGSPSIAGSYTPTVSVTNGQGLSGSVSFGWDVGPATGPVGPARLGLGGMCLNDPGNSSAAGTQATVWTCDGKSRQTWTYPQDSTLRINGLCLTIPGTAKGAIPMLEPCTGLPGQQWRLAYPRVVNPGAGSRPIALVNPESSMCLEDPGSTTTNGTKVALWPCNGYKNEEWTPPPGPVASGIQGKCLDDRGDSTANLTKIDIWACNGTAAQSWTAEPDGTLRVNSKCLDVRGAGTASGTTVDLYSCNGTGAQQWQLIPVGTWDTLVNPESGLCLADPGDTTVNGTQTEIITCAVGDPGMAWRPS
jgi:GH25 family lysozyme M1 (1,4-beta-N-acetylmuramidase)